MFCSRGHADWVLGCGVPVSIIQRQLGHTSLATTDRYLRHIAPKDVVELMKAACGTSESRCVEKNGVHSHRELVGKVFLNHYDPRVRDNQRRTHTDQTIQGDPFPLCS